MAHFLRAFFKPFATHAAHSPIETIVFFSVIGTLAYFHVLTAIKHSAFFASSAPTLRPAHALLMHNTWVRVPEARWSDAKSASDPSASPLELQQIMFSFDPALSRRFKDVSVLSF